MMRVLFDANIIITFLTRRDDPYLLETDKLFQLCAEGKFSGYLALQTISVVWYVLRKSQNHDRRNNLKNICNLLNLAVTNMEAVKSALENTSFTDFEDNLQDCCAQSVGADYIVTANVRDYENHSTVKAVTPSELLDILNNSDASPQWEVHEQFVEYNPYRSSIKYKTHFHLVFSRHTA